MPELQNYPRSVNDHSKLRKDVSYTSQYAPEFGLWMIVRIAVAGKMQQRASLAGVRAGRRGVQVVLE